MSLLSSVVLLAFSSMYTDVGDFPPATLPLWPRKVDKNAIVAMAAALGETHNGMNKRFSGDPTANTPLSIASDTIDECKSGSMAYQILPSNIFPAMSDTVALIFRTNYDHDYGDVRILGLSTGLNITKNAQSASSVARDMATDTASAMVATYGLDVSLFRSTGARDQRISPIHTNLIAEYSRVWGKTLPIGSSSQITLENGIRGWSATPTSMSDVASWCGEWMASSYKPLKISPMTWLEASWCPDKLGMIYKHENIKLPCLVRDWKFTSFGNLRVSQRDATDFDVDMTYDVSCISNLVTVSTYTNWLSITEFEIENYALLIGDKSFAIPVTYAGVDYMKPNTPIIVSGGRYVVETNGCAYLAQKIGLRPFATTNSLGYVDYPIKMTYKTRSTKILESLDIGPHVEQFPEDVFGVRKQHLMYNVTCNGEKYDFTPIAENVNGHIVDDSSRDASRFVTQTFRLSATETSAAVREIELTHDIETPYVNYDWTITKEGFPVDDPRSMMNTNEVYVWEYEGGAMGSFLGHTHDFLNFSKLPPSYDVAEIEYMMYVWPPNEEHIISACVKSAMFGWWHFCKWAY